MKFTDKLGNKLTQLFNGRYGIDQLNWALLVCIAIMSLFRGLFKGKIGSFIYMLIIVTLWLLILTRMFSKKTEKRRQENAKFLSVFYSAKRSVSSFFSRIKDKDHKYFKCDCGTWLRVPKGKGKIKISCPKCGKTHIKKS